jgi:hypothetical protein
MQVPDVPVVGTQTGQVNFYGTGVCPVLAVIDSRKKATENTEDTE